jgi:hypothetical protein
MAAAPTQTTLTRPPAEEVARRGDEIYERDIKPQVEPDHINRIVAIDIDSGDYAVADRVWEAVDLLRARRPDAIVWGVRVGHRALRRYGRRFRPDRAGG